MSIEKKPFKTYSEDSKVKAPLPVKLNEHDELMLDVGMYILNMDSKSGVLKRLAHTGLKVILTQIGASEMHYLTNGERRRYMREKPDIGRYLRKGISDSE